MTFLDEPINYHSIETPFTTLGHELASSGSTLGDPVHRRMLLALSAAVLVGFLLLVVRTRGMDQSQIRGSAGASAPVHTTSQSETAAVPAPAVAAVGGLAPIFTPEVMYWQDQILEWAEEHSLDPNLAAIIMQVESCGDPQAISVAGARGLFQVMPFHFQAGEDSLDPATNAQRGLAYFADRLVQTNGDIGRAFAGYNGGHVAAAGSWDAWAAETQRYYVWTTGLLSDLESGQTASPTLEQWLAAGGASLCRQAADRLGLASQQ